MSSESSPTITKKQSLVILVSSILAALSALAATVIVKHVFEGAELAEFLLFWSVLFSLTSITVGIQPEVTRAVSTARATDASGVRIVPVVLCFAAVTAVITLISSLWWAPTQTPSAPLSSAVLVACGVFFYMLQAYCIGTSSGQGQWYLFATFGSLEAIGRFILMLLVALIIPQLIPMEFATVLPMALWVILVALTVPGRQVWTARADVNTRQFAANLGFALVSAIANSILILGFPVILKSAYGELDQIGNITLAILILAISITRSPIMIPLQVFQGVAITAFVKHKHRPIRAFAKPALAVLGIGVVGAAGAWLIGPWLFSLLYPAKPSEVEVYAQVVTGPVLGLLVFASALLALLTLSGNMVLAIGMHKSYMAGWVLAALVAIAWVFYMPMSMVENAIGALSVGPIIGILVHLVMSHVRRDKQSSEVGIV